MKKEVMSKIQLAAQEFRKAIEDATGTEKVMICWSTIDGDKEDNFASGLTLGNELDSSDVSSMMFRINGRAYKLTFNE